MKQETKIRVFRGEHHFAVAHFLIDMGKCERLHGHNYQVTVEMGGEPGTDGAIIDFNTLNPAIGRVCDSLDHRILLAGEDTRGALTVGDTEVEARFKTRRFIFPREDCVILPVTETTVERLASYLIDRILEELSDSAANVAWIEVGVTEGSSQMALARRALD